MIAYVSGTLVEKEPTHAIIDVSGVGYLTRISLQTYSQLPNTGQTCKLETLQIIREDSHTLFGFHTKSEKQLFEHLISVSGIGPSIALVFLSSLSSQEIKQAIVNEDLKTIQNIKGIGAKTAQRAIIELKDKLSKDLSPDASGSVGNFSIKAEALAALVILGIPKAAAEKSIDNILKRTSSDITLEELIKLSLR